MKLKMKGKKFTFFILSFLLLLSFVFLLRNFESFNVLTSTELETKLNGYMEDICGNLVTLKDVHLVDISNNLV